MMELERWRKAALEKPALSVYSNGKAAITPTITTCLKCNKAEETVHHVVL